MLGHHAYLLGLLKEFDKLCRDNGVEYTLFAGTLLGAIRHGGFIPWDDDLDLCMTYENWEKLKAVYLAGGFPADRVLVAPEIQGVREMQLTRYVDSSTTRYFKSASLGDGFPGEGIDLFIFDPVGDSTEDVSAYMRSLVLSHELINFASVSMNRYRMPVELYDEYVKKAEEQGTLAVLQELEQERTAHFDPNGKYYIYRWHTKCQLVPRRYFEGVKRVPFEDTTLPVPACMSMLLTDEFGPTWPEFPGDIVMGQHGTPHSYDFSFAEMNAEFKPSVPQEEILEEMLDRKRFMIDVQDVIMGQRDAFSQAKALCAQTELELHLAAHQAEFDAALERRDADALYGLLADYIDVQGRKDMIGYFMYEDTYRYVHPIIANVSETVYEAAVFALMGRDKLSAAKYWLEAWDHAGRALTDGMLALQGLMDDFYSAMAAIESGNATAAQDLSARLRRAFPNSNMQLKLACCAAQVAVNAAGQANAADPAATSAADSAAAKAPALERFKALVAEGRQRFESDGFYMKLEGDIAALEGNEEKARQTWMQAVEFTCNGFAITDVYRKTGYYPAWVRNANWAPLAEIPGWDGPLPQVVATDRPVTPASPVEISHIGPDVHTYLYGLLCQVVDACEASGIDYTISPAAAAAFKAGCYPNHLGDYEVFVPGASIPALAQALEERLAGMGSATAQGASSATAQGAAGSNRLVVWNENDSSVKPGHLYLYGTDSTFIRMSDKHMTRRPHLFAYVRPVSLQLEKLSAPARFANKVRRRLTSTAFVTDAVTAPNGRTFRILRGLTLPEEAATPQGEFCWRGRDVYSTAVSGQDLLDQGILPDGYFEAEQQADAIRKIVDQKQERFTANYEELKEQVAAKQARFDQEHGRA